MLDPVFRSEQEKVEPILFILKSDENYLIQISILKIISNENISTRSFHTKFKKSCRPLFPAEKDSFLLIVDFHCKVCFSFGQNLTAHLLYFFLSRNFYRNFSTQMIAISISNPCVVKVDVALWLHWGFHN